jgi:putative endopeptidase
MDEIPRTYVETAFPPTEASSGSVLPTGAAPSAGATPNPPNPCSAKAPNMPSPFQPRTKLAACVAAMAFAACTTSPKPSVAPEAEAAAKPAKTASTAGQALASPALPMPAGLDASVMDLAVDPCTDFFRYACGGWLDRTEIPAARGVWSRGFNGVDEQNLKTLRAMLEATAAGKPPPGMRYPEAVGAFYATCMDEPKLESGVRELRTELQRIRRISSRKGVAEEAARLQLFGANPLFDFGSIQDSKDATLVIGGFSQGGLGLPDRDYYLKDDEKTKAIRAAYLTYMKDYFVLLGEASAAAAKQARAVLAFETRLAKASLDNVSRRDPDKTYHRVERTGLKALAPAFDWDIFLASAGAGGVSAISVDHLPFFAEVSSMAQHVPLSDWRAYLAWRVASSRSDALPKRFQEAHFVFSSKNFSGAKEDEPRWKKCVRATDTSFGEALGAAYVEATFGEEGKRTTLEMVGRIEQAFEANLATLSWMDEATKARAREKARAIVNAIGYPDKWKTYDGLVIDQRSYLGNSWRSQAYENERDFKKIGKPLDRSEWTMTPPTVDATYSAQLNEITFPAGILQPPFFDRNATPAVNLGAMGMVVGHEITHGFDDEGRKFDGAGNLADWWTAPSAKAFEERTACVKTQFDAYVAVEDVKLNGALTLGENTADLGGLKLAFAAMQAYVKAHPEQQPPSRYSADQQFFLGFAQSWCAKGRSESLRTQAQTNPHSTPEWRVKGPLSNLVAFQQAFGCKAGQAMVRAPRCEVW